MTAATVHPTSSPAPGTLAERRTPTQRNTELGLLALAMGIVTLYSATYEYGLTGKVLATFWVLPALLTVVFLGVHVAVRFLAPYADPVILPCVALLNGLGVAFLRRLDMGRIPAAKRLGYSVLSGGGFRQFIWTFGALVLACVLLGVLRDHRSLSRYPYIMGAAGLVLMMIPAVLPARFSEVNNAKLWIRFGSFVQIQPGEFAKLMLLSFFAYYLVRKREVLSLASRRFMGIDFPRGRDLGPILVVWAFSLAVLVFEKDLGTSLLYFGMFVITLYVATERASWLIISLVLFFGGTFLAYFLGGTIGGPFLNFHTRVIIWLHPFKTATSTGYQLVQSLLGLGTGGMFGSGPGVGSPNYIPIVRNDFIFAGMGEEIGLFGLTTLLVVYLLISVRGLRAGLMVRDSFGKLLASGLAFTLGLQVFVIVGGVTRLIPLTGQTTPFMSAGGSSMVANWLLIALLLRISDSARRPVTASSSANVPQQLAGMATEVIR